MRTKALLLGAMIGAASLATSMAQVYSVNIVGYINVPIPHGYCIIANQLNNAAGNAVETLFPAPPAAITVYKFNTTTHQYDICNWDSDYLYWDNSVTLNPGDGFFVYNGGTAFTQTFVGEVVTGPSSVPLQKGFQLISSKIPQEGLLQTQLEFVPSVGSGDTIYKYNTTTKIYDIYNWDADYLYWDPEEPLIKVGDGFFVFRGQVGGSWDRNFSVGP